MLAQNTTALAEAQDKPKPRARKATPGQQLVSLKQIEDEYGPPYRSTYDLCMSGDLPYVRFVEDGKIWIRRADYEALIQRSLQKGA